MSEVKRFTDHCGEGGGTVESATGYYVLASDYDAMAARCDSAAGGWREANRVIAMQRERLDKLEQAEVERDALRAQLDERETRLMNIVEACEYGYSVEVIEELATISTAKEG